MKTRSKKKINSLQELSDHLKEPKVLLRKLDLTKLDVHKPDHMLTKPGRVLTSLKPTLSATASLSNGRAKTNHTTSARKLRPKRKKRTVKTSEDFDCDSKSGSDTRSVTRLVSPARGRKRRAGGDSLGDISHDEDWKPDCDRDSDCQSSDSASPSRRKRRRAAEDNRDDRLPDEDLKPDSASPSRRKKRRAAEDDRDDSLHDEDRKPGWDWNTDHERKCLASPSKGKKRHSHSEKLQEYGSKTVAKKGKISFQCTYCQASFAHWSTLKQHNKLHLPDSRLCLCGHLAPNAWRHLKHCLSCHPVELKLYCPDAEKIKATQSPGNGKQCWFPLGAKDFFAAETSDSESKKCVAAEASDSKSKKCVPADTSDSKSKKCVAAKTSDSKSKKCVAAETSDSKSKKCVAAKTSDSKLKKCVAAKTSDTKSKKCVAAQTSDSKSKKCVAGKTIDSKLKKCIAAKISENNSKKCVAAETSDSKSKKCVAAETKSKSKESDSLDGKNFQKCTLCGATFAHQYSLTLHMKLHIPASRTCMCGVVSPSALTHLQHCSDRHSKQIELYCPDVKTIEKNQSIGKGLSENCKLFSCDVCGATFHHYSTMTKHRQIHKEMKPFKCGVCVKTFTLPGDLKRHMEQHIQDNQARAKLKLPWLRPEVDVKTVPFPSDLKKHMKQRDKNHRAKSLRTLPKVKDEKQHFSADPEGCLKLDPDRVGISVVRCDRSKTDMVGFKCKGCFNVFISLNTFYSHRLKVRAYEGCLIKGPERIGLSETQEEDSAFSVSKSDVSFRCRGCFGNFSSLENFYSHRERVHTLTFFGAYLRNELSVGLSCGDADVNINTSANEFISDDSEPGDPDLGDPAAVLNQQQELDPPSCQWDYSDDTLVKNQDMVTAISEFQVKSEPVDDSYEHFQSQQISSYQEAEELSDEVDSLTRHVKIEPASPMPDEVCEGDQGMGRECGSQRDVGMGKECESRRDLEMGKKRENEGYQEMGKEWESENAWKSRSELNTGQFFENSNSGMNVVEIKLEPDWSHDTELHESENEAFEETWVISVNTDDETDSEEPDSASEHQLVQNTDPTESGSHLDQNTDLENCTGEHNPSNCEQEVGNSSVQTQAKGTQTLCSPDSHTNVSHSQLEVEPCVFPESQQIPMNQHIPFSRHTDGEHSGSLLSVDNIKQEPELQENRLTVNCSPTNSETHSTLGRDSSVSDRRTHTRPAVESEDGVFPVHLVCNIQLAQSEYFTV